MRRRKTDPDVAPELPDKVVSDRYVELTREQAALYEAATADTLARIAASAGIARRGLVLRLLQSLRQICNSPAHFLRDPRTAGTPTSRHLGPASFRRLRS